MFANYETLKLAADHPVLSNLLFLLILAVATAATRRKGRPSATLARIQTDQLRGLAILLIILGHLWTHVFRGGALLIFSADAVALFLFVSGYGLGATTATRPDARSFIARRVRRVMIPYWAATLLILLLDYLLLGRALRPPDLLFTFAGINVSPATQELDYVRWYVTFILFWYLAFYTAVRLFGSPGHLPALFAVTLVLFPIHYYVFKFGWYQWLAFPLGCALGAYRDKVQEYSRGHMGGLVKWAAAAGGVALLWRALLGIPAVENFLYGRIPNLLLALFDEGAGLLFTSALVIGMARFGATGYGSGLLLFFGTISYELYLLHGAFLVKYNPFVSSGVLVRLAFSFTLFLVSVTVLAYLLNRGLGRLTMRRPTTANQVS